MKDETIVDGVNEPVRNGLPFLFVVGAALLGFFVVLPILGIVLLVVAGALVLGLVAFLAAPLLAKLPWFRDRIFVDQAGGRRSVRFGRTASYTSYRSGGGPSHYGENDGEPYQNPAPGRLDDVIDVEGREVPDPDEKTQG